ncbi:penicillin acylase family protein [Novosphingobium sp.]|uniref:penicillin acylase family protein n=1 Tax=Novosphingobium sp. TaxID=1874826 RepID=UPI0025EBA235|nr:penicillin acylase family protein [Novosphingobium sp.]MCC6925025.1 penicillin acylase family protein [Novosphingobium sp.]
MRKWAKRAGWTALGVTLTTLVGLASWEPFLAEQPGPPPPERHYSAEILRDGFGVPHIHGKTDADTAFGVAVAHAEDDFSTLQDVVAMTRGRFGAIAGPDGAGVDFAYHWLGARQTARAHYGELPGDVRAVLDAYASGLNHFARQHPREIKLARLFPVNGEDIATGFALRLPFFFGMDRVLRPLSEGAELLPEHGPPLGLAPPITPGATHGDDFIPSHPMPLPMGADASQAGSNAFAVAPQRAGDGTTRLLSNSHQPYRGGVAWYELVIDSDQGWHFAGATFPGSPYPFMGHNADLGWTNTVNRPDLIDLYKLETSPDKRSYKLGGQWRPFEQARVWLPVRFGPFTLPIPRTVLRSVHGPAMLYGRGAMAVRYAGIGNLRSVEQYYRITKARNFAEWQAGMAIQGVPATNFIYADKTGTIAYLYNAAMPDRKPGPNWRYPVDGTRSDLIWQRSIPFASYPKVVNPASGYVFNSNNTPLLAAGPGSELDPGAIPAIWGVELDLTNRARRAAKLLAEPGPIGRDRLLRTKFDTGYERAGYVAYMLDGIARLDLRGEPELRKAQALLAGWDLTADGKGAADALAVLVLEQAMKNSYGLEPLPDPKAELAKAAAHLSKYFGRIDPPLGELIRIRQGSIDLPMDGGGDTLRAATDWTVDPDGRLSVKHGDSFIMLVEWSKDGTLRSQSIQPYGAATTRPASPHYADQAPLFVAHRFKPVWFTREDAARHARSRKVVSN